MTVLRNKSLSIAFFICIAFVLLNKSLNVQAEEHKAIPETKFGQHIKMSIQYCYSCGYRKAFEDYVNILSEKYPQIVVEGGHYEPSGISMLMSKFIFAVKIMLIVLIVSSFDIFGALGKQTPDWWHKILENKLYACMMIFFIGNMIEGQLMASGAFEITLNDVPVWSKIQTGRIPAPQELFQIIDNQLQFGSDSLKDNSGFTKQ